MRAKTTISPLQASELSALSSQLAQFVSEVFPHATRELRRLKSIQKDLEKQSRVQTEEQPVPTNCDLAEQLLVMRNNEELLALALKRRTIDGFPNYTIDGLGRVRHERSSKFLKPSAKGYITLYPGRKQVKPEDL